MPSLIPSVTLFVQVQIHRYFPPYFSPRGRGGLDILDFPPKNRAVCNLAGQKYPPPAGGHLGGHPGPRVGPTCCKAQAQAQAQEKFAVAVFAIQYTTVRARALYPPDCLAPAAQRRVGVSSALACSLAGSLVSCRLVGSYRYRSYPNR